MLEYPKLDSNNRLLWAKFLLEETQTDPEMATTTSSWPAPTPNLHPEVITYNKLQIGTRGSWFDIGKFLVKRKINQVKEVYGLGMSSVKYWKGRFNLWRVEVIEGIELNIMGHFSFPQGALMMGFVFGDDDNLPTLIRHYLKVTGMSHVTSASGYNIGLVMSLCQPLGSRFWGRRRASWFLLTTIWGYTWLAGASASLFRAGLMASFALVGSRWLDRQIKPIRLLLLSFFALFAWNRALATSLSFQLSASATLGILLFLSWLNQGLAMIWTGLPEIQQPKASQFLNLRNMADLLTDALTTTVAAQIFTMPIIWHHFQELSLVGLVSNTFLLWLTPVITIAGFVGVALSQINTWQAAAPVISALMTPLSWFIWLCLEVFTQGLGFFGQFQQGLISLPNLPWLGVGIWWGGVLGFSWKLSHDKNIHQNRKLHEIYAC